MSLSFQVFNNLFRILPIFSGFPTSLSTLPYFALTHRCRSIILVQGILIVLGIFVILDFFGPCFLAWQYKMKRASMGLILICYYIGHWGGECPHKCYDRHELPPKDLAEHNWWAIQNLFQNKTLRKTQNIKYICLGISNKWGWAFWTHFWSCQKPEIWRTSNELYKTWILGCYAPFILAQSQQHFNFGFPLPYQGGGSVFKKNQIGFFFFFNDK